MTPQQKQELRELKAQELTNELTLKWLNQLKPKKLLKVEWNCSGFRGYKK